MHYPRMSFFDVDMLMLPLCALAGIVVVLLLPWGRWKMWVRVRSALVANRAFLRSAARGDVGAADIDSRRRPTSRPGPREHRPPRRAGVRNGNRRLRDGGG